MNEIAILLVGFALGVAAMYLVARNNRKRVGHEKELLEEAVIVLKDKLGMKS